MTNEIFTTKDQNQISELEKNLQSLGLLIKEDNKRAILDYSKVVNDFKELLEKQQNSYNAILNYANKNEVIKVHIKDLSENLNQISNYFEALMSFFTNPPTKEILELTNHALIIKNVYENFKKFSNDFASLHFNEQLENLGKDFSNHIAQIEKYRSLVEIKLENMTQLYDEFLTKFLNKQKSQLDDFNEKSKNLAKNYDDFLHKNLKFFKGGIYGLVILNIALAISLGILGVYCFIKGDELDKLIAVGNQFGEISVNENEKSINLDFPINAKFVDNGNRKRVILKKDK